MLLFYLFYLFGVLIPFFLVFFGVNVNGQDGLSFGSIEHHNRDLISNQQCDIAHELPTFVRIGKVKNDSPIKLRKRLISLSACVDTCRLNFDNLENRLLSCSGFGVIGSGNEKQCEFYEADSEEALRPISKTESRSSYFEKLCLAIPDHCTDAPFSFELQANKSLLITPIESIIVDDRKRCLNFCLSNPNCKSVNYNQHTGSCQILDKTCRFVVGGLTELINSQHYENTCTQEINRCLPGQRVDFVVTKDARINGLDISLGASTLKSCMRACVDSTVMFCRSFGYNHQTSECVINEEASELSIPASRENVFEPVCLSSRVDIPCTGDYVFERIPNYNLVAEGFIKFMKGPKIDYCIDDCLLDDACITIVYDKEAKTCKLYFVNRKSDMTKAVMDLTTDLYELACDRQQVFKQPSQSTKRRDLHSFTQPLTTTTAATTQFSFTNLETEEENLCGSKLLEHGRTLRLDYRSLHHVHVKTVEQCQELCSNAKINCATFAFNQRTFDCLLSTTVVKLGDTFEMLTQPSPDYSIYSYLGYGARTDSNCKPITEPGKHWWDDMQSTTTKFVFVPHPVMTTTPIYTETAQKTTEYATTYSSKSAHKFETTVHAVDDVQEFQFDGNFLDITQTIATSPSADDQVENSNVFGAFEKTTETLPETTQTPPTSTTTTTSETVSPDRRQPELPLVTFSRTTPHPIVHKEMINRFNERKKFFDATKEPSSGNDSDPNFRIEPPELPRKIAQPGKNAQFHSEDVTVRAVCIDHGVNVTFTTRNQRYTGAVYAAERFSQCRVLVDQKDDFSIFINRPSVNNWCNALETDNIFTVILVLSNDLVLPFDVTTKDDFFYQVTCDFNEMSEGTLVRTGIVVGGPEPKSVMSSIQRDEQHTKVLFKILKDAKPVSNVYMGEQLTALVESDIDASKMRVTECNATRVGGREPRPNSVQLIADGCSLMPQVIGDMKPGERGLEAALTAFRIDGSDQIDIACNVLICRKNCEKKDTCEKVLERHRRTAGLSAPSPVKISTANNEDMVTVDQRLRVLVEDDSLNDSAVNYIRGTCLDPIVLFIVVVLLLLSLISLMISMFTNKLRKKRYSARTNLFSRIEPLTSLPRLERCNI